MAWYMALHTIIAPFENWVSRTFLSTSTSCFDHSLMLQSFALRFCVVCTVTSDWKSEQSQSLLEIM
jgi:hypothetical protein